MVSLQMMNKHLIMSLHLWPTKNCPIDPRVHTELQTTSALAVTNFPLNGVLSPFSFIHICMNACVSLTKDEFCWVNGLETKLSHDSDLQTSEIKIMCYLKELCLMWSHTCPTHPTHWKLCQGSTAMGTNNWITNLINVTWTMHETPKNSWWSLWVKTATIAIHLSSIGQLWHTSWIPC